MYKPLGSAYSNNLYELNCHSYTFFPINHTPMSVTNLLYIKLLLLQALVLSGQLHENHPTDCTGSLLPSGHAVTSKFLGEDGMVSPEGCLARYLHCGKRCIPNYPSSDDKLPSNTNSTTISSTLRHPLSCTPCAQPTGIQHSDL